MVLIGWPFAATNTISVLFFLQTFSAYFYDFRLFVGLLAASSVQVSFCWTRTGLLREIPSLAFSCEPLESEKCNLLFWK